MTKEEFLSHFTCQFLAMWCATHYDEYCMRSLQHLLEKPPVEDAQFLAEKAWEEMQRLAE